VSPLPYTAAEDRVAAAYEAALDHVAGCGNCRAIRLNQAAPATANGVCAQGDRLLEAHREAKRQARQEDQ
jgi:hypothetical protein